jgi:hypothetical protein
VLQLERSARVQVLSEWVTASLYVAGCAEVLGALRAEDRAAAAAVLTERATREPRTNLRVCDAADRPPADPAVLAAVKARLNKEAVTDWCWDIIAIHGPA